MLRPIGNPPSRFVAHHVDWEEPPGLARLQVYEDDSRQILARNDSPDLPHRWSLNPYRGCMHACAYCYARPSHEYLGFGAGTDHDVKILVKPRAAELLAAAFEAPAWKGERVLFSGNTDCYQPLEHRWGLTRACLEVCHRYRNPVTVITKSHLVERDLDLLCALHRDARVDVVLSIPFANAEHARKVEPGTPSPERRFTTVARLAAAGLRVAVNLAPVIPGINDREVPEVLRRAKEAGATRAAMILVRLNGPVQAVFTERIRAAFPLRAEGVLARLRRARQGELGSTTFGERMRGHGPEWEATHRLFQLWCDRLGLNAGEPENDASETPFRRPTPQLALFTDRRAP